ncbi:MotA/TolQ/ExbB proton channel family protein [Piscinibacter gummiphilus]|uniref:Biopolymer transport protein ExbB n=1 Tax=Piscinibacter gummiphilus TaxID=946333 RepID=A0ABZ0CSW9_9BURK|nr:MotA/TolQ/ExbB proton channel family protein [Piscinibacter gummiphilus]WOB06191.1 MotA/TolQ/ExbB proton channel family protein [Piscinibacter gummiphilus]
MSILQKLHSLAAGLLLAAAFAAAPAHAQAPASAPVAVPSVAVPAVTKESVENPYDLKHMLMQGDKVTLLTFGLLVLMSLASWYILVTKLIESAKLAAEAKLARANFFKSATLADGLKTLKPDGVFQFIAESGIEAGRDHSGELTANIDRNTWIGMSVQRAVDTVHSRLQDGLAVLATVGSTAPFIGLFGTVWGILNALTAIGIAGQASIDKVAGPVGEALIMTAIGLAVAVPAVLGYNWLVRRNKVAMESVRGFGADLHGVLLGSRAAAR